MPPSTDPAVEEQNKKYNEALARLSPFTIPQERDFSDDLKSSTAPLYYLLANWMQQDPEFYKKLARNNIDSTEQIIEPFNQMLNEQIENIDLEKLNDQKKYWEIKLETASEKSQKSIRDHIEKIKDIITIINYVKTIADIPVSDVNTLISKRDQIIALQKEITQLNQNDDALKKINILSGTYIATNVDSLLLRKESFGEEIIKISKQLDAIATDAVAKEKLEKKLKNIPGPDSLPFKKTEKKVAELAVGKQTIGRSGVHADPQLFRDKTYVYFNGKSKTQEEWRDLLETNPKLKNAMDYFDGSMADAGKIYLFPVLGFTVEPTETHVYFEETEHGITCVSEARNYKNTEETSLLSSSLINSVYKTKTTVIPGSSYTVYTFNEEKSEEGFDWTGIYSSNTLLNAILNGETDEYANINEQQIRAAQKEECISALLSLRNSIKNFQPPMAQILLYSMCKMMDKIKDQPDANLKLLTELSKTTKEYIDEPSNTTKASKFFELAPKIEKEYDASGKKMAYLMIGLFITLSVLAILFTGGVAELLLVATLGEIAAEAVVTIAGAVMGVSAMTAGAYTYEKNRHMTPLYQNLINTKTTIEKHNESVPQQQQLNKKN